MTKITSAFAAALIASASFASVALADGDYYEGAKASASVDHVQTGSIVHNGQAKEIPAPVRSGDYYEGANRPN